MASSRSAKRVSSSGSSSIGNAEPFSRMLHNFFQCGCEPKRGLRVVVSRNSEPNEQGEKGEVLNILSRDIPFRLKTSKFCLAASSVGLKLKGGGCTGFGFDASMREITRRSLERRGPAISTPVVIDDVPSRDTELSFLSARLTTSPGILILKCISLGTINLLVVLSLSNTPASLRGDTLLMSSLFNVEKS